MKVFIVAGPAVRCEQRHVGWMLISLYRKGVQVGTSEGLNPAILMRNASEQSWGLSALPAHSVGVNHNAIFLEQKVDVSAKFCLAALPKHD